MLGSAVLLPLDSVPFWKTAFTSSAIVSIDVNSLPPERRAERELLKMQDIDFLVGAPINKNGVFSGFIGVDNPRKHRQNSVLATLGDYTAALLTRRDLLRRLEEESRTVKAVMDGVPGGFCRFKLSADERLTENYYSQGCLSMLGMIHAQIAKFSSGDLDGNIPHLSAVRVGKAEDISTLAKEKYSLDTQRSRFNFSCRAL